MSRTFVKRLGFVNYIQHEGQYYKDKLHSYKRMSLLEKVRAIKHRKLGHDTPCQIVREWRFRLAMNAEARRERWEALHAQGA